MKIDTLSLICCMVLSTFFNNIHAGWEIYDRTKEHRHNDGTLVRFCMVKPDKNPKNNADKILPRFIMGVTIFSLQHNLKQIKIACFGQDTLTNEAQTCARLEGFAQPSASLVTLKVTDVLFLDLGLGKFLLNYFKDLVLSYGASEIQVTVGPLMITNKLGLIKENLDKVYGNNTSIKKEKIKRFYESQGFKEVEETSSPQGIYEMLYTFPSSKK